MKSGSGSSAWGNMTTTVGTFFSLAVHISPTWAHHTVMLRSYWSATAKKRSPFAQNRPQKYHPDIQHLPEAREKMENARKMPQNMNLMPETKKTTNFCNCWDFRGGIWKYIGNSFMLGVFFWMFWLFPFCSGRPIGSQRQCVNFSQCLNRNNKKLPSDMDSPSQCPTADRSGETPGKFCQKSYCG